MNITIKLDREEIRVLSESIEEVSISNFLEELKSLESELTDSELLLLESFIDIFFNSCEFIN